MLGWLLEGEVVVLSVLWVLVEVVYNIVIVKFGGVVKVVIGLYVVLFKVGKL